jgi:hypothetical protein
MIALLVLLVATLGFVVYYLTTELVDSDKEIKRLKGEMDILSVNLGVNHEALNGIIQAINDDRTAFLSSMTRDERAAYRGAYADASEDPTQTVRTILSDWHDMRRKMLNAEAAANAAAVRDLQHGPLQQANAELVEIITGTRNRLQTSPESPFGIYTGRFPTFSRLALFLIDQALRAPGVQESIAQVVAESAKKVQAEEQEKEMDEFQQEEGQ